MNDLREKTICRDMDHLRLLGISRIPRCANCPRLPALAAAVKRGPGGCAPVPDAPRGCRHEVCRPLILRYFAFRKTAARALRLVEVGGGCR